jgi:hypothetical protein
MSKLMTQRRNRPVYDATVYHDGEFDANETSKFLGYFPSLAEATRAVNEARDDHWQTGGVTYGFLWEAVFGESPERFESDDREPSWFVGIDGKADR